MRDFSWKYFAMTGDVGAYLLFKEASNTNTSEPMLLSSDVTVEEKVDYEDNE